LKPVIEEIAEDLFDRFHTALENEKNP